MCFIIGFVYWVVINFIVWYFFGFEECRDSVVYMILYYIYWDMVYYWVFIRLRLVILFLCLLLVSVIGILKFVLFKFSFLCWLELGNFIMLIF